MSFFAYKLIVSPALVALATLAGRRWGDTATGLVAGLPIVAGPVLFFYALEQGPGFAALAATATLLGMLSLCCFLLAFGWRSWLGGTPLSCLGLGWVAFALMTLFIDHLPQGHGVGPVKALVYALAALYLGRRSLPPLTGTPRFEPEPLEPSDPEAPPGSWDLPLRMLAAALLVLALTGLAGRLGPRLGGLLTPFPVASSVLLVFAHLQGGREAARAVLKGFFLAFNSFAVFCAVLALALTPLGLGLGFGAALAAACLTQAFILKRVLN